MAAAASVELPSFATASAAAGAAGARSSLLSPPASPSPPPVLIASPPPPSETSELGSWRASEAGETKSSGEREWPASKATSAAAKKRQQKKSGGGRSGSGSGSSSGSGGGGSGGSSGGGSRYGERRRVLSQDHVWQFVLPCATYVHDVHHLNVIARFLNTAESLLGGAADRVKSCRRAGLGSVEEVARKEVDGLPAALHAILRQIVRFTLRGTGVERAGGLPQQQLQVFLLDYNVPIKLTSIAYHVVHLLRAVPVGTAAYRKLYFLLGSCYASLQSCTLHNARVGSSLAALLSIYVSHLDVHPNVARFIAALFRNNKPLLSSLTTSSRLLPLALGKLLRSGQRSPVLLHLVGILCQLRGASLMDNQELVAAVVMDESFLVRVQLDEHGDLLLLPPPAVGGTEHGPPAATSLLAVTGTAVQYPQALGAPIVPPTGSTAAEHYANVRNFFRDDMYAYFCEQVLLTARLCSGRFVRAVELVKSHLGLTPDVVWRCVKDNRLPKSLRAHFCKLYVRFHVDAAPQRSIQPVRLARVIKSDDDADDGSSAAAESTDGGDHADLSGFAAGCSATRAAITWSGSSFVEEKAFVLDYVRNHPVAISDDDATNLLSHSVLNMCQKLLQFGKYKTDDVNALLTPMVCMLDGRSDEIMGNLSPTYTQAITLELTDDSMLHNTADLYPLASVLVYDFRFDPAAPVKPAFETMAAFGSYSCGPLTTDLRQLLQFDSCDILICLLEGKVLTVASSDGFVPFVMNDVFNMPSHMLRFSKTSWTYSLMRVKVLACHIVDCMLDRRLDNRLTDLIRRYQMRKPRSHDSSMLDISSFIGLHHAADEVQAEVEPLTEEPLLDICIPPFVLPVLLDLTVYDYPQLSRMAFGLLFRYHTFQSEVLQATESLQFVMHADGIRRVSSLRDVILDAMEARQLVERADDVLEALHSLTRIITSPDASDPSAMSLVKESQRMMFNLGVHDAVMQLLLISPLRPPGEPSGGVGGGDLAGFADKEESKMPTLARMDSSGASGPVVSFDILLPEAAKSEGWLMRAERLERQKIELETAALDGHRAHARSLSSESGLVLMPMAEAAIAFFHQFVSYDNKANQAVLFSHMDFFLSLLSTDLPVPDLLSMILIHNRHVCVRLSERQTRQLLHAVRKSDGGLSGHARYLLDVLHLAVVCDDKPVPFNQDMVLRLLKERHAGTLADCYSSLDAHMADEEAVELYTSMVRLIGRCCLGKSEGTKATARSLVPVEALRAVMLGRFPTQVKAAHLYVVRHAYLDSTSLMKDVFAHIMDFLDFLFLDLFQNHMCSNIMRAYLARTTLPPLDEPEVAYLTSTLLPFVSYFYDNHFERFRDTSDQFLLVSKAVVDDIFALLSKQGDLLDDNPLADKAYHALVVMRRFQFSGLQGSGGDDEDEGDGELIVRDHTRPSSWHKLAAVARLGHVFRAKDRKLLSVMGHRLPTRAGVLGALAMQRHARQLAKEEARLEDDRAIREFKDGVLLAAHEQLHGADYMTELQTLVDVFYRELLLHSHASLYAKQLIASASPSMAAREPTFVLQLLQLMYGILTASSDPNTRRVLQSALNKLGAAGMVLRHLWSAGRELEILSLELGVVLMEGGNVDVQRSVFVQSWQRPRCMRYIGDLLHDFIQLLEHGLLSEDGGSSSEKPVAVTSLRVGGSGDDWTEQNHMWYRMFLMLRFVQMCCENHFVPFQDYLREQPNHKLSVPVISLMVRALVTLEPHITPLSIKVALQLVRTLTETLQGPNRENQRCIVAERVSGVGVVEALNRILEYRDGVDATGLLYLALKWEAVQMLLALIEGSTDLSVPMLMMRTLNVEQLLNTMQTLSQLRVSSDTDFNPSAAGVSFYTLLSTLMETPGDDVVERSALVATVTSHSAYQYYSRKTGSVEIVRDGVVQRLHFEVPAVCWELAAKPSFDDLTKTIMFDVEKSVKSNSERIRDFFARGEAIMERHLYQRGLKALLLPNLIARGEDVWQRLCLALAIAINVLLIMFARGGSDDQLCNGNACEFALPYNLSGYSRPLFVLSVAHTVTALLMLAAWSINWNSAIFHAKEEHVPLQRGCMAHAAAKVSLWLHMLWSYRELLYLLTYVALSVAGTWWNPFFFAFHLADAGRNSKQVLFVGTALAQGLQPLLSTLGLVLLLVYFYGVLGFLYIRDDYESYIGDEVIGACDSLLACMTTHFTDGVRLDGGIAEVLTPIDPRQPDLFRIFFDVTYFLLVVVFLLGIVQAIIVDGFTAVRNARTEREAYIESRCFICGIEADIFRREAKGFKHHVTNEHNAWMYLFFLVYLREKPCTLHTGLESFVSEAAAKRDYSFMPANRALAVDRKFVQSAAKRREDDVDDQLALLHSKVDRIEAMLLKQAAGAHGVLLAE
eukprot:PLAT11596.2.p1 GENE.PLAT11596.2~~PLAT11596.2.p1  ORF type:complete len:2640 (-),score=1195.07 PLAT11596.2:4817-11941(-)